MTSGSRIAVLAGVIAVAVVGFVIANGSGSNSSSTTSATATATSATGTSNGGAPSTSTTTTPTAANAGSAPVFRIRVSGAKPVGGVQKITVKKGQPVNLVVTSDVADEVHIHGYDFHRTVKAGGTVRFSFPATIDGSFEIELESRKEKIAQLTVQP
jgi:hypothetical protein